MSTDRKAVTAYPCAHCRKLYKFQANVIKHEDLCKKNPENIPMCFDCMKLEGGTTKGDFYRYCECYPDGLYGPILEKRRIGHLFDNTHGEYDPLMEWLDDASPMPKKCEAFLSCHYDDTPVDGRFSI